MTLTYKMPAKARAQLYTQLKKINNPFIEDNMKRTILSLGGLLLGTNLTYAQANILPAKAQSKPVIITGATIHIGNGKVISNGYIAFDKGKITAIGEGAAQPGGADIIDAKGKQVYPGFICPVTTLGLVEIEEGAAVRLMNRKPAT
jgi:hypothetical protein